jgi:D-amino-acid dehydrogenase
MTTDEPLSSVDVVVLGAGIVGVSVAAHLAKRGRSVALVDRRLPGEEASFGNGGLIQREGVFPHAFPHGIPDILRYGMNRQNDVRYHPLALLQVAPFLLSYWRNSSPQKYLGLVRQYAKLIEHSVAEHQALAEAADASHLLKSGGWLRAFRTHKARDARLKQAEIMRNEFGLNYRSLDAGGLQQEEPYLAPLMVGAIDWTDPFRIESPHALTMAYFALFQKLGGRFVQGDARTFAANGRGWQVTTAEGVIRAGSAVVALGAAAPDVTTPLGYNLPLAVKRGYHMHYSPAGDARLNRPVLDTEGGYLLSPNVRGIRLTTGIEFAQREAPRTPVQLAQVEPLARSLFPLDARLDPEPWMGLRPCTPDMMPIIGPAPRHSQLWFAFGHAHHGLTLGPVTGRLIAEMMTNETPFVDPAPFDPRRF